MFGLALNTSHFKKERFTDFVAAGKIFLLLFFIPAVLTIFIEMRTRGIKISYIVTLKGKPLKEFLGFSSISGEY